MGNSMRALAVSALLLSGCASLSTTSFDAVEYNHWVQVSHVAKQAMKACGTATVLTAIPVVTNQVELAVLYSETKIANPRIGESATILNSLALELTERYARETPTANYCKLKLQLIDVGARRIAESLSKKES